jgi:DNA-directed RNA polymerase subunit RPC12/RpoP
MQQYRCPECGTPINYGAKFCSNCGNKLNWVEQPSSVTQYYCPSCNAPVMLNAKYCNNCGSPLSWQTQPQTPPPPEKQANTRIYKEDNGGNKVLKGIGIAILSIILFLLLSAFGPAFMMDRTMLNPDFTATEIDRLQITDLLLEALADAPSDELPPQLQDAISRSVIKLEPMLKQEINNAVYSIYDYLKDKRDSPELMNTLRSTLLSNDFLFSVVDELDTTSLIKSFIEEQLPSLIPQELSDYSEYLNEAIDEFLIEHETWIKEQLKTILVPVADYMVGDIKTFNVEISLDPLIADLKETIMDKIEELDIPLISLLPDEIVAVFVDDIVDQYTEYIPSPLEVNNSMIGAHVPAEIASNIGDVENTLAEIKGYVGTFQTVYILLIVFILLLIAGIILIYREVKKATRTLGIVILIAGVVDLALLLLTKNMITSQMTQAVAGLPSYLQTWMVQLITNMTAPMQILSICFIAVGVVLVIVSVIYKPRESI